MRDLSEFHGVLGDVFRDKTGAGRVDDEQMTFFREKGYLTGIPLLNVAQVNALRHDAEALAMGDPVADPRFYEFNVNEAADPSKRLFHALGAWRVAESFHDLVFFRPLVSIAEQLLGSRVRLWHDQLFIKPAADGGVVAWHQDYSYWTRTKPAAHLTCWVALDDSNVENGCVHYVPGSHRWPLLPRGRLADDMDAIGAMLTDQQRSEFIPTPVQLKAGEASFHHPMLVHGSFENRSDRPRRGAVVNFISDGVISDTDEPLLAGVPVIPTGDKIAGRYFPLL